MLVPVRSACMQLVCLSCLSAPFFLSLALCCSTWRGFACKKDSTVCGVEGGLVEQAAATASYIDGWWICLWRKKCRMLFSMSKVVVVSSSRENLSVKKRRKREEREAIDFVCVESCMDFQSSCVLRRFYSSHSWWIKAVGFLHFLLLFLLRDTVYIQRTTYIMRAKHEKVRSIQFSLILLWRSFSYIAQSEEESHRERENEREKIGCTVYY